MAGDAWIPARVLLRVNLGERRRPADLSIVADQAEPGRVGKNRPHGPWIRRVCREGAVAGFAVHRIVLAPLPGFLDVGMAIETGGTTRECDGARGDIRERPRAEVAVQPEILRNEYAANHQEGDETEAE